MPRYVIANEGRRPFSPACRGTGLSPEPSAPSVAEATGPAGLGLDHARRRRVLRGFVGAGWLANGRLTRKCKFAHHAPAEA